MARFFVNLLRLTRPLSNVKSIALVLWAFYLSGKDFDLANIIVGIISLSLISSAVYAYNSVSDIELDKTNKNKRQYSEAAQYFGEKHGLLAAFFLAILGLICAFYINVYFVSAVAVLLLIGFLYSSPHVRFKEKVVLDILFGAFFAFMARFAASWFIFSISAPPLLPVIFLISAKAGGYLLYKEHDYSYLSASGIKNSITVLGKKAKIILSAVFFLISLLSFIFICLNSAYLHIGFLGAMPLNFLFLIIFAVPPVIIIYLSVFNKLPFKIQKLRVMGFAYWLVVLLIILALL